MARIDVGAAIGAGFSLIRHRPLSVLAWGVPPVLLQVGALLVILPTFSSLVAGNPQQPPTGQILVLQGVSQLINLVQLLLNAILYCAVWRAVLQPQRSSFAYLRLGGPEFFVTVLTFAASIALGFAMFIVMIPALILGGIAGGATHSVAVGLAVGVPIAIAVFVVGGGYLALRFAFVGPMMVLDGRFHLFESWAATRGRVGALLLIGLGLLGIFLAIELVLLGLFVGGFAGMVLANGGFAQFMTEVQASPLTTLSKYAPLLIVYAVLLVPLGGCFLAIGGAPWARAYRDLLPDHSEAFA
jgi:hypothetical protein